MIWIWHDVMNDFSRLASGDGHVGMANSIPGVSGARSLPANNSDMVSKPLNEWPNHVNAFFFLPLIWRSGITTGIHQLNVLDYVWCSASRNSNQTKENHCAEIGNPISSWCFRRKYCPMGSEQTRRIYWLRPFGDGAMWGAPDGDGHAVILRLMYWCHLYAWNQCTAQVYQISWIHLLHPQNASFWWGWWGAFYFSCFRGLLKRIDFVLLHVALSLFGCATGPLGRFKSRVDNLFPPLGVFRLQHVQCTADFQAPHESTGYLPI